MPVKKETKLLLIAFAIPLAFVATVFIRELLEYYFRFSVKYHYIYGNGSSILFFIQLLLIFISLAFSLYLVYNRKGFRPLAGILVVIASASVFLYVFITVIAAMFFSL